MPVHTCRSHSEGAEQICSVVKQRSLLLFLNVQSESRDLNETKSVKLALGAGGDGMASFVPLVSFVLGSSEVVKSFIVRHVAPDLVTFTRALGQPGWGALESKLLYLFFLNVEELGSDEQGDVMNRETEEDFITSAIERCIVRAVYLFACR